MNKYIIENEGDKGQIQMVSGGFGDSTQLDEATIKALVLQQKEQEKRNKENQDNLEKWNIDDIDEEYQMESNMFDYESVKILPNFGVKKYADSVFRGELDDTNQRSGFGVMVYRKNRVYEGNWFND